MYKTITQLSLSPSPAAKGSNQFTPYDFQSFLLHLGLWTTKAAIIPYYQMTLNPKPFPSISATHHIDDIQIQSQRTQPRNRQEIKMYQNNHLAILILHQHNHQHVKEAINSLCMISNHQLPVSYH